MSYIRELKPDMHGMEISCILGYNKDKIISIGQIFYNPKDFTYSILQNIVNGNGYIHEDYLYSWYCSNGTEIILNKFQVYNIICKDKRPKYSKYYKSNNISNITDTVGLLEEITETDSHSVKLLTKSKFITINQNE